MRIVSLVPSMTETLFALGAGDSIVGVTDGCIHPAEGVAGKEKVGGARTLRVDRVLPLRPDLVLAGRGETAEEHVEQLRAAGLNVWLTGPVTIADVLDTLSELPKRTGVARRTTNLLLAQIKAHYEYCQNHPPEPRPRVACLTEREPYRTPGRETYVHHLIEAAGGTHVQPSAQHPEAMVQELEELAPEILLLRGGPAPFNGKHAKELASALPCPAVEHGRVHLVPGEDLCWHGARTPAGLKLLYSLFSPGARWGVAY
ncbi:MAG: ABC transporter substrate-binding protein [Acidobacteriota bacterium]|nr:MAG: ABC transporter substrate-binding protein [Acidobacteriota bacterium]